MGHVEDYHGVDIQPELLDWAKDNLTDEHTRFTLVDAHNARYNPDGDAVVRDPGRRRERRRPLRLLGLLPHAHPRPRRLRRDDRADPRAAGPRVGDGVRRGGRARLRREPHRLPQARVEGRAALRALRPPLLRGARCTTPASPSTSSSTAARPTASRCTSCAGADAVRSRSKELAQLAAENERLRERVAKLRKRAGRYDDLSYLFVMTYGRSGSTLVSGLLNAIPGYLIRGENRDALRHLFAYHRTLATEKARGPAKAYRTPTHPFFGIGDVPLRQVVHRRPRASRSRPCCAPRADTRVVGFKEIRWYRRGPGGLRRLAAARSSPAPGSSSTPAPTRRVLASGWWADGRPRAQRRTPRGDRGRGSSPSPPTSGTRPTTCTTTTTSPTRPPCAGLYAWLGEPWDEASVRATMAVRHSV